LNEFLPLVLSFVVALGLTPVVILAARRWGMVARPKEDRWHSRPTALLGGIALFVAFMAGALPFLEFTNSTTRMRVVGVLVGAALIFVLGLIDDLVQIKPASKLIGQIVAACLLAYCGVYFDILGMPLVTIPLTMFFVVGITNAFNLLDNMDGLASGVAAICVLAIFFFNRMLDNPAAIGVLCLALAGALLGFLVYNFNPARIFMGDSGSMFLGFMLAAVSILGTWEQASNTFLILAVPVLVLGLPIFDTTFVTVTRRLAGRPVSQGGSDHTSHRLVKLGLSERKAVLILYAICACFALIAVLSQLLGVLAGGIFGILALIVVFWFGVFLAQEKLYKPVSEAEQKPLAVGGRRVEAQRHGNLIGTLVLHKMRMVEVLIDLLLFGAAYVGAYLIRFEGDITGHTQDVLIQSLPIVVAVKLLCFYAFRLYRRLWAFIGIHDLVAIARAVTAASLISVFVIWGLTRLSGYSRAVFVLDALLLLVLTAGSRILFRVFSESVNSKRADGRRLLIYGAGAAGELLLRELRSDPELGYQAIGFLDDDASKSGKRIHGLRIYGGRDRLIQVVKDSTVEEIVIAIPSLDSDDRHELEQVCAEAGVTCRTMRRVSSTFLH